MIKLKDFVKLMDSNLTFRVVYSNNSCPTLFESDAIYTEEKWEDIKEKEVYRFTYEYEGVIAITIFLKSEWSE